MVLLVAVLLFAVAISVPITIVMVGGMRPEEYLGCFEVRSVVPSVDEDNVTDLQVSKAPQDEVRREGNVERHRHTVHFDRECIRTLAGYGACLNQDMIALGSISGARGNSLNEIGCVAVARNIAEDGQMITCRNVLQAEVHTKLGAVLNQERDRTRTVGIERNGTTHEVHRVYDSINADYLVRRDELSLHDGVGGQHPSTRHSKEHRGAHYLFV